ncbi:SDR family NAD(P)-dependent oxidoreductase [Streptomyces sp. NPDC050418]|uniref:SDR family NAD(P)-dependent oxidoreductase n=1 Tax=Streptomyces sp. NPDC050418 TaxID=3365612 RepID=UPI003799BADA
MSPLDLLDLRDHTVVLTGGSGALGTPIIETLLRHGARVAVADQKAPPLTDGQLGADERLFTDDRLLFVDCDLTADATAGLILDTVTDRWGLPGTVCAHAGLARSAPLPEHSLADYDDVMRLNARAAYALAREASRRWMAAGVPGHLIFTGSWVQDVPWPGIAPYAASKAALRSLARSFARELAPHGIRANVVAPGIVDAGMARHQWDTEPDYRRRASRAIPLGRLQPAESVAHAVLFLCSPMASYMTGSTLVVDGGASLYPMDEDD